MELVYKKIEKDDKEQLLNLIGVVLKGLTNPDFFIPYDQWELDNMFDEVNYACLRGAYDGNKLVAMGQLYISQNMLTELKKELGLNEYKVCELGGNLVLPEYRRQGIATNLELLNLNLAKELGFDYIVATVHPDNIGSRKALEKAGLKFIKETILSDRFLRKLYMKKLKNHR